MLVILNLSLAEATPFPCIIAKLALLLGDKLLEGLNFFLMVKFYLAACLSADSGPFCPLNFDLFLGDSAKQLASPPSGALWLVLPEWVLKRETTDFPQFVKSEGDFIPFDLLPFFSLFFILNYLLLLSWRFSSIFSNDDSLEFIFCCLKLIRLIPEAALPWPIMLLVISEKSTCFVAWGATAEPPIEY